MYRNKENRIETAKTMRNPYGVCRCQNRCRKAIKFKTNDWGGGVLLVVLVLIGCKSTLVKSAEKRDSSDFGNCVCVCVFSCGQNNTVNTINNNSEIITLTENTTPMM